MSLDEFELPSLWRVVWDWLTGKKRPSLARLMLGSGMVNASAATHAARAASSLVFSPPVSDIDLLDWDAFDVAIERGYESTREALSFTPRCRG
jgi:NTE family protein